MKGENKKLESDHDMFFFNFTSLISFVEKLHFRVTKKKKENPQIHQNEL